MFTYSYKVIPAFGLAMLLKLNMYFLNLNILITHLLLLNLLFI